MKIAYCKRTLKGLPPKSSVLIRGRHGLGKSEVVRQTAQDMSIETGYPYSFVDIRLSQREVGDIIGMPRSADKYTVTKTVFKDGKITYDDIVAENVTIYDLPTWVPQDQDSHGFLFLDEIDRACREVQQCSFEMVLDYRLNLHEIPIGWRVIAAVNADTDLYSVSDMDPALLDRFLVIDFKPTYHEWIDWASGKSEKPAANSRKLIDPPETVPVHDCILKYLTKFEGDLDTPEKIVEGKSTVYQSRRAWVLLSNAIKYMQKNGDDVLKDLDYLTLLAKGYVGSVAINFTDFIAKDYDVLSAKDILNKWDRKIEEKFKKMQSTEMAFYNKIIVEHIVNEKIKLNKKQSQNLFSYYKIIPKEMASGFWSNFLKSNRDEAVAWYNSDPEIKKYTQALLSKSEATAD